jgi:hypothetical protein
MDRELNKIVNLLRFTILFKDNLYNHSPDYIIEKYDHFIDKSRSIDTKMGCSNW